MPLINLLIPMRSLSTLFSSRYDTDNKPPPNTNKTQKKEEKPFDFSSMVAEMGFEPHDLRVMSPTSYHCSTPRCIFM